MTDVASTRPAGWYDDPSRPGATRWWTGTEWYGTDVAPVDPPSADRTASERDAERLAPVTPLPTRAAEPEQPAPPTEPQTITRVPPLAAVPLPDPVPTGAVPTGAVSTDAVSTGAVPTDAVPTESVPTDAVPTDSVPTDAMPNAAPAAVLDEAGILAALEARKAELARSAASTGPTPTVPELEPSAIAMQMFFPGSAPTPVSSRAFLPPGGPAELASAAASVPASAPAAPSRRTRRSRTPGADPGPEKPARATRSSAPAREKPAREKPVREKPVREKPVREKPVREEPARERPVRDRTAREKPAPQPAPAPRPKAERPPRSAPTPKPAREPRTPKAVPRPEPIQNAPIRNAPIQNESIPPESIRNKEVGPESIREEVSRAAPSSIVGRMRDRLRRTSAGSVVEAPEVAARAVPVTSAPPTPATTPATSTPATRTPATPTPATQTPAPPTSERYSAAPPAATVPSAPAPRSGALVHPKGPGVPLGLTKVPLKATPIPGAKPQPQRSKLWWRDLLPTTSNTVAGWMLAAVPLGGVMAAITVGWLQLHHPRWALLGSGIALALIVIVPIVLVAVDHAALRRMGWERQPQAISILLGSAFYLAMRQWALGRQGARVLPLAVCGGIGLLIAVALGFQAVLAAPTVIPQWTSSLAGLLPH